MCVFVLLFADRFDELGFFIMPVLIVWVCVIESLWQLLCSSLVHSFLLFSLPILGTDMTLAYSDAESVYKCLCRVHKCTLTGKMKENIDPMPGSVAWHPVVLPVKTLCSPLTLKQNAGRMFVEYWGNCSWGGPIKSVSNECVCVNRTGCSRGNDPIRVWPPGFWIRTWMFLPCSMFLDGMPGLTNMQSVSRLVQASTQIYLFVPLDRIKLWSLHNQLLTIKMCFFSSQEMNIKKQFPEETLHTGLISCY